MFWLFREPVRGPRSSLATIPEPVFNQYILEFGEMFSRRVTFFL